LKASGRIDSTGDPIKINEGDVFMGQNLVAVKDENFGRVLLASKPIDDTTLTIDNLDAVEDWTLFGDALNLTKDSDNYVKGSASINWDISDAGGTTAGIQNSSLDTFDLSDYLTDGSVFIWVYLSSSTDVTNFIIRLGNDSSNYYYMTVTTDHAGNAFKDGWNLLRFAMSGKTETGTVDDDNCDYCLIYMTKDAGKVSETDYRFDNIVIKIGDHYDVVYYSRYGWYTAAGAYLENSTQATDLLNADTDEVEMIEDKMAELSERHLKNHGAAKEYKAEYELKRARYLEDNPSEALLETQTYYNI
jgi:hypothetical protein